MSSIFHKVIEMCDLDREGEVPDMLSSIDEKKLLSMIKSRLVDSLAPRGLSIILSHLCGKEHKKQKIEFILGIMEEVPKLEALTTVQLRDITNAILVDMENMDANSLAKLVSFCIAQMGNNDSGKEMWKEMLPRLLLLLKEKPLVHHCGQDYSGADYRGQIVKIMCNSQWKSDTITMTAAMFRELPLEGEEFSEVLDKLLKGLPDLDASEVPPFVYQMLRLGGQKHFLLVLMHVEKYFKKNLTDSVVNLDADSIESVSGMTQSISADLKQSESTVLFHVQKCAAQQPQSSKNLAASLTQLTNTPEIMFGTSTFLLSSALMICDVEILREKYMIILVNGLVRCVQDEELRRKHFWTVKVLAPQNKLEACLKKLIENTDIQRGVILEQFVKFCFEVLINKKSVHASDVVAVALMHVVKKQPDAVSVILELLVCNIMRNKSDPQLLRCLKKLVAMTPAKLLMKVEFISINMVEHLVNMQPQTAEQAIVALMPLLSRAEGLCNNLIVNLRKAINRPLVATRQMAVTGLLTMIERLRIKKFNMLGTQASQHFSSSSSVCSQMSSELTLHGSGTSKDLIAVHLELMQILTHALSCQAEVRLRLYKGISHLPKNNKELGPAVLNFLFKNLAKCRDVAGNNIIDYEKCYKITREDEIVLLEPVGHLIFAIVMVLRHMKNYDTCDKMADEIEKLMEDLCDRMIQITTTDLGFDKDNLVIEEGFKGDTKVLVLSLAMNVCEAVIAYLLKIWADTKEQVSRKMLAVFKTYLAIRDHLKGCKRPAKKKDPNNSAAGSQAINPRKRGRPANSSAALELGNVALGPILDLNCLHSLMELLFCDTVDWADSEQASLVQNKQEFVKWALNSLLQAIAHYKSLSCNGLMEKTSPEFNSFCHIARILFDFLSNPKIQDMVMDAQDTAVLLLECLSELITLFQQDNHTLFSAFISATGNGNFTESAALIIPRLLKLLGGLFSMMQNEDELELSFKKLPRLVLAILSQLANVLDNKNPVTETLAKWLQKAAKENKCDDEQVVKGTLELLLVVSDLRGRSTGALGLFTQEVLSVLGSIDDNEDEAVKKLKIVDESQTNVVIQVICAHIRHSLELISILIQRLKSERCLRPYYINEECEEIILGIGDKEMEVSDMLNGVIQVVKLLLNTRMGAEQGEALLRDVCVIYRTATNYCRHFSKFNNKFDLSLKKSKFHSVVLSAGRYLPPLITSFISHLEEKQKEKYQEMQGKKKFNAKVAQRKVLRESDTFARTMLEYERFSKAVFQLSAKAKDPSLKDMLHLGLSHDFRLNYNELNERLLELEDDEESEMEEGNNEVDED